VPRTPMTGVSDRKRKFNQFIRGCCRFFSV
jgi:hypothetical protein